MEKLQNSIFRLEISPEKGTFSILPLEEKFLPFNQSSVKVIYFAGNRKITSFDGPWQVSGSRHTLMRDTVHGDVDCVELDLAPDDHGIQAHLVFGIVQEYPLVIWKISLTNRGAAPVAVDRVVMLDVNGNSGKVSYPKARRQSDLGFFSNGWASWSASQWYAGDGKMRNSHLGPFQLPMIKNAGTPKKSRWGEFTSDFFAVVGDQVSRTGALIGFLAQKQQFGTIYANFNHRTRIQMWANGDRALLKPGATMETDWAVYNPVLLDHRDPLEKFTEAAARENNVHLPEDVPVGWCSWYHYYTKVTASDVKENLRVILEKQDQLPIQLVQLDDGFETRVGDWFTFNHSFPDGVATLSDEIQREGLIPGLWLAPFIIHPDSNLMKNHPDWILRNRQGKPVNAGLGWGKFCTALDLTVPAALEYAVSVIRTAAMDWRYRYLKLDFLYAAALPGRYSDPTLTRAQVMRRGLEAMRDAMGPDVFFLGCGAPLGSALGLVDAMRIGADVSGDWSPKFAGLKVFFLEEPSMPCSRNSISNILTRANLHRHWWMNDPDCLLVRPGTALTLDEVRMLATVIGLTGGSLLLSDDLTQLPEERMKLAEALLPVIGERARVLDWFDHEYPTKVRLDMLNKTSEWHLVGGFNWEDYPREIRLTPAALSLDEGEYWICEFWSGQLRRFSGEKPAVFRKISPHGCIAGSIRRVMEGEAQYLGSDLHLSQGMEVVDWNPAEDHLELTLRLPRTASGNIVISVPQPVEKVLVNGDGVEVVTAADGVIQIPVKMDGFAHIEVFYCTK